MTSMLPSSMQQQQQSLPVDPSSSSASVFDTASRVSVDNLTTPKFDLFKEAVTPFFMGEVRKFSAFLQGVGYDNERIVKIVTQMRVSVVSLVWSQKKDLPVEDIKAAFVIAFQATVEANKKVALEQKNLKHKEYTKKQDHLQKSIRSYYEKRGMDSKVIDLLWKVTKKQAFERTNRAMKNHSRFQKIEAYLANLENIIIEDKIRVTKSSKVQKNISNERSAQMLCDLKSEVPQEVEEEMQHVASLFLEQSLA